MTKRRQWCDALRQIKSCLCLLLVLNLHWFHAGCGSSPVHSLLHDTRVVMAIDASGVLGRALAGTSAAHAKVLDVDLGAMTFALKDRDGRTLIGGRLETSDAGIIISNMVLRGPDRSAEVDLDSARRVTSIRSNDGTSWTRTMETSAGLIARQSRSLVGANRDLLSLANDLDSGKFGLAEQSQLDPGLATLLSAIAALLAPIGGVLQPLLIMFSIMTAIEAMQTTEPQIQMGVSGAYVIEYYLNPGSRRRAFVSEFDTDRTATLLGGPDAAPAHILLRSNGAVMHVVTDGQGGFAGVRSGSTLLILDGTAEQVTAYFADRDGGGFKTASYLAYEIIDVLAFLSAQPRDGRSAGAACMPPDGSAETVAGFPIPTGSVFENIAADSGLGADSSFCTQLSIYSAVLFALERDGFINQPAQPQRDLVGWGSVAAEAGLCRSLYGPTQTCTELMRPDDKLLAETAGDDEVLKATYDATQALLGELGEPAPHRLRSSLEYMASQIQPSL